MGFAEGRLGLQPLRIDETLDHDFGFRGHHEIDGLGLHHIDRRARKTARHGQLIEMLGHFLHGRIGDRRRTAHDDSAGHFLAARLVF